MYGSEGLNEQYLLRFALTKEFFETFAALKYKGIELPLTMVRPYHVLIQSTVDQKRHDQKFVHRLQRKHQLYHVRDAQKALLRLPKKEKNLAKAYHRRSILIPGSMADFAVDQLAKHSVYFINATKKDNQTLQKYRLPKHMTGYNYHKASGRFPIPNQMIRALINKARAILKQQKHHIVFGSPTFQKWLELHIRKSSKIVGALDAFIRQYPIGVIVNQTDIINPGTTLALLARKYNIPFIYVPENLNFDKSIIPTRAHYYCVWGNHYKSWLHRRGIHAKRILKTGNLRFFYTKKRKYSLSVSNLKKQLQIPQKNMIATFATQPMQYIDPKINLKIIQWLKKSIQGLPISVIIRPHPADTTDYRPYTTSHIKRSPHSIHLYDLLKNTDCLLTISSNTAIEAAMFRKKIIVLQPKIPYHYEYHNNDYHRHLVKANAGPIVKEARELRQVFDHMLNNRQFNKEMLAQGQQFLAQTIEPQSSPVLVRNLIRKMIAKR